MKVLVIHLADEFHTLARQIFPLKPCNDEGLVASLIEDMESVILSNAIGVRTPGKGEGGASASTLTVRGVIPSAMRQTLVTLLAPKPGVTALRFRGYDGANKGAESKPRFIEFRELGGACFVLDCSTAVENGYVGAPVESGDVRYP